MLSILFYCVCLFFPGACLLPFLVHDCEQCQGSLGIFTVFQCYSLIKSPVSLTHCIYSSLSINSPSLLLGMLLHGAHCSFPVRFPLGNEAPKSLRSPVPVTMHGEGFRIEQHEQCKPPSCMAVEWWEPPRPCDQQSLWGITTSSYHFQALSLPRECFTERKLGQSR